MRNRIYRITVCAMCAALYFVLGLVSVKAGNLRLTFASLPTLICAALYGPGWAAGSAALGEFLNQWLSYGLMPTTAMWMIPPVVRALLMGLWCVEKRKRGVRSNQVVRSVRTFERRTAKGIYPENYPVAFLVCNVITAIITTLANTLMLYLDARLTNPVETAITRATAGFFPRIVAGIAVAVICGIVAPPVLKALRKVVPAK